MGGCQTNVTVEGSFGPMERVLLTANGNLQRIMRYACISLAVECSHVKVF
jgi:hypothetical protein